MNARIITAEEIQRSITYAEITYSKVVISVQSVPELWLKMRS